MKKIMIIPGTEAVIPAIRAAKELGLYVITADNQPENPGHRYADEYANVSILELDALAETARSLHIDGIMTLASDLAAVPAAYVAEKLRLPSVGPYESVRILQDKGRFRAFLKEHGFNVPWAKAYTEAQQALAEADMLTYPVMVKPTDSCGSRGVTAVQNKAELASAIADALKYSRSGWFIVEEFLESDGYWSDSDAFSVDGQFRFLSFSAEGFDRKCSGMYTPGWQAWPATMDKSSLDYARKELQRLISLLHMGTGLYNIAVMKAVNGKVYIMECSPRSGGNRITETLEYITGSDLIKNMVRSAVGLPLSGQMDETIRKNCISLPLHSSRTGIFRGLRIKEEIEHNIVYKKITVKPGDMVYNQASARDRFGLLTICFDTAEQLRDMMSDVESYVRAIVDEV